MRSIPNSAEAGSALYNPDRCHPVFPPATGRALQVTLLTYGLIFAIAALGFNLLLGCTGLLSFVIPPTSAWLYAVAFIVKYLNITSMEVFLLGVSSLRRRSRPVRLPCVRYTRIFFGILTWRCPKSLELGLQVLLANRRDRRVESADAVASRVQNLREKTK